jgi:hypothetical protein
MAATGDPQDAGQYVDGLGGSGSRGLRTAHMGYDCLFLIGDMTWQDCQIKAEVTVHDVARDTGPLRGGNGVGVAMRFAGRVVGGPRRFPIAQPKWGYQPFGGMACLRVAARRAGCSSGPAIHARRRQRGHQ